MKANNTKISAGTIARTIVLVVALLNQVLAMMGKSPLQISDEAIGTMISTGATIIMTVIAWWQNNSFTKEAIMADAVMNGLKEGATLEDVFSNVSQGE